MKRRDFLKLTAGAALFGMSRLGCHRLARPSDPDGPLSPEAMALIEKAWTGVDPSRALDCHAHLVGLGTGNTGAFVHPHMRQTFIHPIHAARFEIYVTAAGVKDLDKADEQYVDRLVSLVQSQPKHGRLLLLAFDKAHREDGSEDLESTEFFTPNDYVLKVAKAHPDCFLPAASVHPYRKDALSELERCAGQGAQAVKWLPNAMLIDPGSAKCDAFYRKMVELKLPLLTHAGEEKAVESEASQRFGNPLLFRRALDAGVKVIVAHCASLGTNEDLDAKGTEKPQVDNYELFLRLATDGNYRDRLYGDVSALIQYNRCEVLQKVLAREDLHDRLINGTDYPLPAINALIRTGKLESMGLVSAEERKLANEIDRHNPLAFDFVLKRMASVEKDGKRVRFPDSVFMVRPGLFPGLG